MHTVSNIPVAGPFLLKGLYVSLFLLSVCTYKPHSIRLQGGATAFQMSRYQSVALPLRTYILIYTLENSATFELGIWKYQISATFELIIQIYQSSAALKSGSKYIRYLQNLKSESQRVRFLQQLWSESIQIYQISATFNI